MLVGDSRFGAPIITENDAARAMMLVDQAGLPVRDYAIWEDRFQLLGKVTDPDVSDWMNVQFSTQRVLDQTQAVVDATRWAQEATQMMETSTQAAEEMLQTETQIWLEETLVWQVETQAVQTAEAPISLEEGEIGQYAARAIASSEYADIRWSAGQAARAPDTLACGDYQTAWASRSSSGSDWLLLTYAQAVIPTRIIIYETYNPGAISKVEVLDQNGAATSVYTAAPATSSQCPNRLVIEDLAVDTPIISVKLTLNHTVWSEIDAVQLIGKLE
jgi:hypothetical protein